ncbi:nuclear transport factor 2 family protein [Streptomyces sp. NPDC002564]|uniref:nuclear transport factor 2 family protein n=1 Tax=Streptomyces sp. NPDC002564 TaxID=3364649 RepID=UPI0036B05D80
MDDATAVAQLVLHERQARNRHWWDAMRQCYATDSLVRGDWFRGSGAEFVTRSQAMAATGPRSTHRLGPAIVDIAGSRALAELPTTIEITTRLGDTEALLACHTRLLYRTVRITDSWRISALDPIYERDNLTPTLPGAALPIAPEEINNSRTPYRFLRYVLHQYGYTIPDDLYGDDRPEPVAALYEQAHLWLRGAAETEDPEHA